MEPTEEGKTVIMPDVVEFMKQAKEEAYQQYKQIQDDPKVGVHRKEEAYKWYQGVIWGFHTVAMKVKYGPDWKNITEVAGMPLTDKELGLNGVN